MRTIEHTIGKYYLPALINGDYDTDTLNNTYFTKCEVSDLLNDCVTVKQIRG